MTCRCGPHFHAILFLIIENNFSIVAKSPLLMQARLINSNWHYTRFGKITSECVPFEQYKQDAFNGIAYT